MPLVFSRAKLLLVHIGIDYVMCNICQNLWHCSVWKTSDFWSSLHRILALIVRKDDKFLKCHKQISPKVIGPNFFSVILGTLVSGNPKSFFPSYYHFPLAYIHHKRTAQGLHWCQDWMRCIRPFKDKCKDNFMLTVLIGPCFEKYRQRHSCKRRCQRAWIWVSNEKTSLSEWLGSHCSPSLSRGKIKPRPWEMHLQSKLLQTEPLVSVCCSSDS